MNRRRSRPSSPSCSPIPALPDGQITLVMWSGVFTVTVPGEAVTAIGEERVSALADAAFS